VVTAELAKAGVVAIVFAEERNARSAKKTVRSLMRTHALCVDDMALAARGEDDSVVVRARRNFLFAGIVGGVAWGMVLGGLFFQPLLGVAAGLIGGVVSGLLSVSGLDPDWVRETARTLRPGETALVLAVNHAQDADALALVAGDSGRVVMHADREAWAPERGGGAG